MNRRNFFNKLSAAVAGVYLGLGIDLKKLTTESLYPACMGTPNATYETAEYAVHFWCGKDAFKALNVGPPPSVVKEFNPADYQA